MKHGEETLRWQTALDEIVADTPWLSTGLALESCGSTQDECRACSRDKPGLIVTTLEQTKGRGRMGRVWNHDAHAGLAVTFSLDASIGRDIIPIAVGLATAAAAAEHIPALRSNLVGVKWPNDVVVPVGDGTLNKLAGVLVEASDDVLFVGIGLNVRRLSSTLVGRTSIEHERSLAGNYAPPDRLEILRSLVREITKVLQVGRHALAARWQSADRLIGLTRSLRHNNIVHTGVITSIDPFEKITLRSPAGEIVSLPARSTLMEPQATPVPGEQMSSPCDDSM